MASAASSAAAAASENAQATAVEAMAKRSVAWRNAIVTLDTLLAVPPGIDMLKDAAQKASANYKEDERYCRAQSVLAHVLFNKFVSAAKVRERVEAAQMAVGCDAAVVRAVAVHVANATYAILARQLDENDFTHLAATDHMLHNDSVCMFMRASCVTTSAVVAFQHFGLLLYPRGDGAAPPKHVADAAARLGFTLGDLQQAMRAVRRAFDGELVALFDQEPFSTLSGCTEAVAAYLEKSQRDGASVQDTWVRAFKELRELPDADLRQVFDELTASVSN